MKLVRRIINRKLNLGIVLRKKPPRLQTADFVVTDIKNGGLFFCLLICENPRR